MLLAITMASSPATLYINSFNCYSKRIMQYLNTTQYNRYIDGYTNWYLGACGLQINLRVVFFFSRYFYYPTMLGHLFLGPYGHR